MDLKTVMSTCMYALSTTYDEYSDSELLEEVSEYYPDLLEETDISELEDCANNYTTVSEHGLDD